jgi:DegV family protein with EDD domain
MTIRILADSACDLPESVIQKNGLKVFPIPVILGDEVYKDNVTIKSTQMFDEMKTGKVFKTSQISRGEFQNYFRDLCNEDIDAEYVYICFSSGLTKIFESATMALKDIKEEFPDFKLTIIDTKCASMGYGLAVLKGLELADTDLSSQELVSIVEKFSSGVRHVFTVDDLTYLYRGGRLSKTSYFVGNMLNVKPILHLDNTDGKLYPYRKTRGTRKMLHEIIDIMKKEGNISKNHKIGISHGNDTEKLNLIKEMIFSEFEDVEIVESMMGCAVGAHTGPGALAIFF